MKVVFSPQYLTRADIEDDLFVFNTSTTEITVGFI